MRDVREVFQQPANAVRLRIDASRCFKQIVSAEAMSSKLLLVAQKILARAERTASDAGCLRRKTLQIRNYCARDDRTDKDKAPTESLWGSLKVARNTRTSALVGLVAGLNRTNEVVLGAT